MAIKVKKKSDAPQEEEMPELPESVDLATYDALHEKSFQLVGWIEDNRNLVIGGVVAIVVASVGTIFAFNYMEARQVEASVQLSEGLAAYEVLVEGSADLEALRGDERIAPPKHTFQSEEEKWQTIYDKAGGTLADHDRGEIGRSARLTKASAAFKLGKVDESIALYEAAIEGATGEVRDFAYVGLASALAAKGEHDRAIATYEKLAANPEYAPFAKYEKARLLQRAGKTEDAKNLFHEILETHPTTTFRDDIERRLAML